MGPPLPCHQVQVSFSKPSLLGSRQSKSLEIFFSLQQISCHFVYSCFGDHTLTFLTQEKLKCRLCQENIAISMENKKIQNDTQRFAS